MNHQWHILAEGDDMTGMITAVVVGGAVIFLNILASILKNKKRPGAAPPPLRPAVVALPGQITAQRRHNQELPAHPMSPARLGVPAHMGAPTPRGRAFMRPGPAARGFLKSPVKLHGGQRAAVPRVVATAVRPATPPPPLPTAPTRQRETEAAPLAGAAGSQTSERRPVAQVMINATVVRKTLRPANLRALIALNEVLQKPLALRGDDA